MVGRQPADALARGGDAMKRRPALMSTESDEAAVLKHWGDDELGPGNGSVGQGLSDLVLRDHSQAAGCPDDLRPWLRQRPPAVTPWAAGI